MNKERENFDRFVEVDSLKFAVKGLLMQGIPGTLIVDVDGTLKRFSFGLIGEKVYCDLEELSKRGWEIIVVTNQSTSGHIVARCMGNLLGCPNYPDSFLDRGWPVFGGGWNFLWSHYKEGSRSVSEVSNEVNKSSNLGCLVMVGDKESDVEFFNRLVDEVKKGGCRRETMFLKIPFLGMPVMGGVISRRLEGILP